VLDRSSVLERIVLSAAISLNNMEIIHYEARTYADHESDLWLQRR